MTIKEIVEQVIEENEFGKPWKWGDNAAGFLIPILRTAECLPRDYNMLEEVQNNVTIEDTGHIGSAKLVNKVGKMIFVRGGTILAGQGTQSRAVQTGTVVWPGKQEVSINCVHASHGINPGASFSFQGYAPRMVSQALRNRNQTQVWTAVASNYTQAQTFADSFESGTQSWTNQLASVSPDNLVETEKTIAKFKGNVDDAIRRMPRARNQVGVVIFDMKGVVGVEVFDHPDSWKALCESVIKQYGDVIEKKLPDFLTLDPKKAVAEIKSFMNSAKECVEEQEQNCTVVLHCKEVSGEYTRLNGDKYTSYLETLGEKSKDMRKFIHLLLSRVEILKEPVGQSSRQHISLDSIVIRGVPATTYQVTGDNIYNPTWTTNINTNDQYYTTFFSYTGASELLTAVQEPQRWKDLAPKFRSPHTLQRITDRAVALGLVNHQDNSYSLTAKGQEALSKWKTREE